MSFTLEIKTSVDGSLPDAWKLVFYKRHTQCSCYNSFGGSLKSKCFCSKQNLLQKFCWQEKSCFSSKGSPPSHNTPDGILSSGAWEEWQTVLIMTFAALISQAASIILASLFCERSQSLTARTLNCSSSRNFTSVSTFKQTSQLSLFCSAFLLCKAEHMSTALKHFKESKEDCIS